MNMGVGEALVSVLEAKGTPTMVERTLIKPPFSRIGPAKKSERDAVQADSPYGDKYNTTVDRHSAHEMLQQRAEQAMQQAEQQAASAVQKKATRRRSNRQSVGEAFLKSVTRSLGSQMGRSLMRGVLGSLFRGR